MKRIEVHRGDRHLSGSYQPGQMNTPNLLLHRHRLRQYYAHPKITHNRHNLEVGALYLRGKPVKLNRSLFARAGKKATVRIVVELVRITSFLERIHEGAEMYNPLKKSAKGG